MSSNEGTKWYGWLMLALIIGLIIYSLMPDKQMTPAQVRQLAEKSEQDELLQAKERCADQEGTKYYDSCVQIERKRISDELDERARESMGR
jgi:hypothetical protein